MDDPPVADHPLSVLTRDVRSLREVVEELIKRVKHLEGRQITADEIRESQHQH